MVIKVGDKWCKATTTWKFWWNFLAKSLFFSRYPSFSPFERPDAYKCYTFSESYGSRETREIKISTSKFDLEARGILSSLWAQTGPWSDTASYPIHHCWCSISPDIWPDCLAYVQFSVENSSLLNLPRLCEHIIPRGMMALTLNQLRQVQTKRCRISGSSPSSQRERLKVPLLKPSQLKIQNWR